MNKTITLNNGAVVTYHKIISSEVDYINNQTQFLLASYVDKTTCDADSTNYLDSWNFTMTGTSNSETDAYNQAMTYDKYSGATIE